MCGITGIFAFNQVGAFNLINLAAATQKLEKRGPDNQGLYNDEFVGLGHRRLSIIDTSYHGNQPMWDASGRYCIVFNGEIYNYRELRKALEGKQVEFRSQTDTEVLLYLFIHEGKACLERLNGFFAFAIYDKQEQSIFIARDRMGIKPLYYYQDEDKFLFASEMKSIIAYGLEKEIDFTSLYQYLQLNYITAPNTILKGVKKLPPGHWLKLVGNEVSVESFYSIPYNRERLVSGDYKAQQRRLSELLESAVQKRLVADVPLGAFLSGGIDSSVIAALASKHKPDLHTFSIGYKDEKFFDETEYARLVAQKLNTEHTVFSLTNDDLFAHLFSILDYIDEPFADSSAIAVNILSMETRKHATVALSGDGADEMFAGYNKHAAALKVIQGGKAANMVKSLLPVWKRMPKSRSNPLANKFRQLQRFAEGMHLTAPERYWRWASFVDEGVAARLLHEKVVESVSFEEYYWRKESLLQGIPESGEKISDLLYADMQMVLPDDMLTKVDRMSMANSLEVRVPFLDHDVVNYVFSLPDEYKINGQIRKRILQDTFRQVLPERLYRRPKKGFEVPLLKWFRKELKGMITEDYLKDAFIEEQGIFDLETIQGLKKQLFSSNPGDVHARIWGLLVFQHWWRRYFS
ncbi:MAG: asparagine synthase (glutamine-hydrolyzing) [Bacteroidota bacterium]